MVRLRYVFLLILITALGSFGLGLMIGYSAHRVSAAGKNVEIWADNMSLPASLAIRAVLSEDADPQNSQKTAP